MLTREQLEFWDRNGYLVLPGVFTPAEIDALERDVARVWETAPSDVVVDDMDTHRRRFLSELSAEDKKGRFKVNDLYLNRSLIREAYLHERIVDALNGLLGQPVVLGSSLSFEKGSQQPLHVDSIYLTPESPGHLVATWIALEDADPDSGPLQYLPGSHRIPPYRFSDGGYRAIASEMEGWTKYMHDEIARRGLKPFIFHAKKGDVFIWHAELVHGGTPINDPRKTRKSLVAHYFSLEDSRRLGRRLHPHGKAFWHERPAVGTVKQLSEILPASRVLRRVANSLIPQRARTRLKRALRRMLTEKR